MFFPPTRKPFYHLPLRVYDLTFPMTHLTLPGLFFLPWRAQVIAQAGTPERVLFRLAQIVVP